MSFQHVPLPRSLPLALLLLARGCSGDDPAPKAEAPARVGWAHDPEDLSGARAKAEALKRQEIFVPYSGQYAREAAQSLARCGVEAVPADKFF